MVELCITIVVLSTDRGVLYPSSTYLYVLDDEPNGKTTEETISQFDKVKKQRTKRRTRKHKMDGFEIFPCHRVPMKKSSRLVLVIVGCLNLTAYQALCLVSSNGQPPSRFRSFSSSYRQLLEAEWKSNPLNARSITRPDVRPQIIRQILLLSQTRRSASALRSSFHPDGKPYGSTGGSSSREEGNVGDDGKIRLGTGNNSETSSWMEKQMEREVLIQEDYVKLEGATLTPPNIAKAAFYELNDSDQNRNKNDFATEDAKSLDTSPEILVLRSLWYLPALSILSGISPACRIIAESHVSRLPDTPIAHEIDTLLLWPAIGNSMDRDLPPTVFQTPAAAITDVSQYQVDWDVVSNTFISNVATSLMYSSAGIALFVYCCLLLDNATRARQNS